MLQQQIKKIVAIAAMDQSRVIGFENTIPWAIPGEQKRFAELTKHNTVLMGRLTFESLPEKFKPLPQRLNVVATSRPEALAKYPEVHACADALGFARDVKAGNIEIAGEVLWIIGGEKIYRATLALWDEVYLTLIPGTHPGDAFFPEFESRFVLVEREDAPRCSYLRYIKPKITGG